MSLEIGGYVFEGPYTSPDFIDAKPGMFVVFCHAGEDYRGLDCGISEDVRVTVQRHVRTRTWYDSCKGAVEFAVLYSNEDLDAVEEELRQRFKFPCRDAID